MAVMLWPCASEKADGSLPFPIATRQPPARLRLLCLRPRSARATAIHGDDMVTGLPLDDVRSLLKRLPGADATAASSARQKAEGPGSIRLRQ